MQQSGFKWFVHRDGGPLQSLGHCLIHLVVHLPSERNVVVVVVVVFVKVKNIGCSTSGLCA